MQLIGKLLDRVLRALKGWFGSNLSKSTKFGPDVAHAILFRFPPTAKTGDRWGRHIGIMQYGRQRRQISALASELNSIQS